MRANMDKILPVVASVGVGIATYQMLSGKGGKMKNMVPLATNLMGMGTGMPGQNKQQPEN
ncbi:hypothetical protein V8V75_07005 [Peribacillus frigoritolerans]|uniref:hypothetical protein n=1 Tax=Peribacillus frigoritolerans TaxID=450367 RepID=UPI003009F05C